MKSKEHRNKKWIGRKDASGYFTSGLAGSVKWKAFCGHRGIPYFAGTLF